eukprot:5559155-Pleurochrysis_carterae.AAC.1
MLEHELRLLPAERRATLGADPGARSWRDSSFAGRHGDGPLATSFVVLADASLSTCEKCARGLAKLTIFAHGGVF